MLKRCLFPLAFALVLASALPARAAPSCDQCKDLPNLYRQLLQQEFLRAKFQGWVDQAYYPATIKGMQEAAQRALTAAMNGGTLYGPLTPGGAGATGGGGQAEGAFGTIISGGKCELVEYVKKNGETVEQPTTPDAMRKKMCKAEAEFTIAHEMSHIESCRAARQAKDKTVETVQWFVKDDIKAYEAGIKVLREHIAKLARQCNWSPSSMDKRADKKQVPTPDEIVKLAANTKSKAVALNRGSRK